MISTFRFFVAFTITFLSSTSIVSSFTIDATTTAITATTKIATNMGSVHVPLHNLRNLKEGKLYVGIFEHSDMTNKHNRITASDMSAALHHKVINVDSSSMDITFDGVEHGEYAVLAYHDMSITAKLDSNFLGIPCEDLCISNNAKGGPRGGPKWDSAKFCHGSNDSTKLDPIQMVHFRKQK